MKNHKRIDDLLVDYLCSHYEPEDYNKIIMENGLLFVLKEYDVLNLETAAINHDELANNKVVSIINKKYIEEIVSNLNANNIIPWCFKGHVLQSLLYDDNCIRPAGDIDLYVENDDFSRSVSVIENLGFVLCESRDRSHHYRFRKGHMVLELHRRFFNPFTEIDESVFSEENVILCNDFPYKYKTLNYTLTLLHLIYHLYMDACLSRINLLYAFEYHTVPAIPRFFFRAYEIALFAYLYNDKIEWKKIIDNINSQNLRSVFQGAIKGIDRIFYNVFPYEFMNAINRIIYMKDERDYVYDTIKKLDQVERIAFLTEYIKQNRNTSANRIELNRGQKMLVCDNSQTVYDGQSLLAEVFMNNNEFGVVVTFIVLADCFSFSEENEYEPLNNEGVHILLCSAIKGTYSNLFIFLKNQNNKICPIVFDLKNNKKLEENCINASFEFTNGGYSLSIKLNQKYLYEKGLDENFYFGFVISNCDKQSQFRKNEIISSSIPKEWYNPAYHYEIIVNHI